MIVQGVCCLVETKAKFDDVKVPALEETDAPMQGEARYRLCQRYELPLPFQRERGLKICPLDVFT